MNSKLAKKIAIITLIGATTQVQASLISGTHYTNNGKKVNLQGLEWMSLDYTAGFSRSYIESGSGFTDNYGNAWAEGEWRYASRRETGELINSIWGGTYDGWSAGNADGASWFLNNFSGLYFDTGFGNNRVDGSLTNNLWRNLDSSNFLFGADQECNSNAQKSCYGEVTFAEYYDLVISSTNVHTGQGYTAYDPLIHSLIGVGSLSDFHGGDFGWTTNNLVEDNSLARSSMGSLMVRTSVPEPSTFAILALGIVGLISRSSKR